ncbi:MAG: glutamate--tRNA ligase [Phycisphaerales bacterium]|nr:MAG: glutamate--tRNA ligase [Phycisphaerales bacterium]
MTNTHAVRVRFAPSPTGYLHIGGARTVLFNWLVARKAGGTFVLRIEDTDRTRHVEDSVRKILDDLRWLGLTWDEGPEAGGEFGPYFQSKRLEIYNQHLRQLLESGDAYYALETPEELAALREKAKAEGRVFCYQRPDPIPTIAQGETARKEGKQVVVRFKMPGEEITVVDEILGEVTLAGDQLEDFVIQKGDGYPTYHFACVVDDALMKITHVLRGQEHLMNTPRHIALQRALGFDTPRYAHLPVIFNIDGSKMSKRDKERAIARGEKPPEIDVHDFRASGYLPEAVVNFIALLGWSPGDDRESFTIEELADAFDVKRIGKSNARFDREKLLSFNTDWAVRVTPQRLLEAFKDYLEVNESPMRQFEEAMLVHILECCKGFRTFSELINKTSFLYKADEEIECQPKAVKKVLVRKEGAGFAMLEYLLPKLQAQEDYSVEAMETFFGQACKEQDTKLGNVAQPVRVAITGTMISPPIFDSLAMLGKQRTVSRIKRCLNLREQ